MGKNSQSKVKAYSVVCFLFFLLILIAVVFFAKPGLRGEELAKKFDISVKMINGENLPAYLPNAEKTADGYKYLLVRVLNWSFAHF